MFVVTCYFTKRDQCQSLFGVMVSFLFFFGSVESWYRGVYRKLTSLLSGFLIGAVQDVRGIPYRLVWVRHFEAGFQGPLTGFGLATAGVGDPGLRIRCVYWLGTPR